jgi:glycosyltransferase involved in cell wall biosynthesis
MRVIALLATYNERRFIRGCIEHLHGHGIETYLIDNCSTDGTVTIAERHLGRGLCGIEEFPRRGRYEWRALLERKEQLATELEADWFIHLDADEVRLPPPGHASLAEAIEEADADGYNAVNFFEFTFVPTHEEPDHDHASYARTLRTYYPFAPRHPNRLNAWKATEDVDLASRGGHLVRFADLKMRPQSFPMKHYLFLSVPHAIEKYVERRYDPGEVESGWHGWRARLDAADIRLPSESELRQTRSAEDLDPSEPRRVHLLDPAALSPGRR